MVDFLLQHESEAINMLFTEFNMDDALDVRDEEGIEAGIETGIQALISSCKEFGISYELTFEQVMKKFNLNNETTEKNMNLFW